MKISIIIPTYNRAGVLFENIQRIRRQKQREVEIIVVDDGSDKENIHLVEKIKNIILIKQLHRGPAAARNTAVRKASGEILLFINDDTKITEGFVAGHRKYHIDRPDINRGVFGPFLEIKKQINNAASKWLIYKSNQNFDYKKACSEEAPWYYFWTCNVSIKKDFLVKNNLFFDETFPTAAWEDIEFAYRAMKKGLKLEYKHQLKAYHDHSFSLDDVLNRFYSHGRGLYHLGKKLPAKFLPPMALGYIRKPMELLLGISLFNLWEKSIVKMLRDKDVAPNCVMQVMVIAQKIKGYEYERMINQKF